MTRMNASQLEPLHRFHSYCARFPSGIAEAAIEKYTKRGDSVFDPFCGSGTTLTAAKANQRSAVGTDVDTLAGILSEIKCQPKATDLYETWRTEFSNRLRKDFAEISANWPQKVPPPGQEWSVGSLRLVLPSFPELSYWFPPQVIAALSAIANRARAETDAHLEKVALIALSACIVSKWPNTLSYAMDIDHTRPHRRIQRFTLDRVMETFSARLERTTDSLGEMNRLFADTHNREPSVSARVVYPHDARVAVPELEAESQALVVTSPPYFNAVDYPRAHRLSVCWMNGFAPEALVSRRGYVGLHCNRGLDVGTWLRERRAIRRLIPSDIHDDNTVLHRLCGFYDDLKKVLEQVAAALRPGGHAVFVIANNVIRGNRIASHRILGHVAKELGFSEIECTTRQIESYRRRFPVGPFGFDGPMTHEYVVVLRKPRGKRRLSRGDNGSCI